MILFKENVRIKRYSRSIHCILTVLQGIDRNRDDDYPDEIVVTSINDSQHMVGSKHGKDQAVDIRSKTFSKSARSRFFQRLTYDLGKEYTVLLEDDGLDNEHIHAQSKKGLTIL